MVNFLVGVVVATMVLVPPLLFVIWMWRTDTRLLSRLLRQEREATRRMMRVRTVTPTPTQGTTTSATSESSVTRIGADDIGQLRNSELVLTSFESRDNILNFHVTSFHLLNHHS